MAYADLYDANNVKIGNAIGYLAPFDATPTPALPANTVPLWDDWSLTVASWEKLGSTEESFQVNSEATLEQHQIEEQPQPVAVGITSQAFTITAQLAEDTLESMSYAWNGVITASVNVDTLVLSSLVNEWAFGLEMENTLGLAKRFFVTKGILSSGGATSFRRAASKRLYPITFTSTCKPEEIIVKNTKVVA